MDHQPYIDAAAATLGLQITPQQRPGVTLFFNMAANMAGLLEGLPLTPADESGAIFVPVGPDRAGGGA